MTDIHLFTHEQFGTIRTTTDTSGEAWFVAVDICAAIGLSNTTVVMHRVDADERSKFNLSPRGDAWWVNEAGFCSLVLSSRKPEAKSFKRWVTHEVLPSIRKHGGYLTPEKAEEILDNPDTIIELATKLKSERAKHAALEKQAAIDAPKGQSPTPSTAGRRTPTFAEYLADQYGRWMTYAQAASELSCSPHHLKHLTERGQLACWTIGDTQALRLKTADVAALMRRVA